MKRLIGTIAFTLWLHTGLVKAQDQLNITPVLKEAILPAYPVSIGWDHTTALVFPAKVVSVDRGHGQIMAKMEDKAPNLLWLKAGKRSFATTNLHVVTADARLYHFKVSYDESLARSSINIARQELFFWENMRLRDLGLGADKLERAGNAVMEEEVFLLRKVRDYRMKLKLEGIYQKDGLLFFRLRVDNRSRLAFEPEDLVFSITDKKQAKYGSVREEFLDPVLLKWQDGKGIAGHRSNVLVAAFPQFTLSDNKQLVIQLKEKNGDRNLRLKVRGRDILKTRNLTDVQPETE
ncbi:conjugative transposon protein TraN [Echinicola soli]|uniref:Conjugative transposon protein TraN n=1 Tax=Echinicola soli TaxID=2591634 RepID=A0A514CN99_9BACT|nr:conjugative transposon protein TraN [Echinicola soli]QDH81184.1 conjugative transposon protein TraN [Echinicola soli]